MTRNNTLSKITIEPTSQMQSILNTEEVIPISFICLLDLFEESGNALFGAIMNKLLIVTTLLIGKLEN